MQYQTGYTENMYTFVNDINTVEGGMHLAGFRAALTRVINDYARKNNFLKPNEDNLSGDDVREGLTCVISVKVPNPQFEGQTKTKLGNLEVKGIVDNIVSEGLKTYLEEHPQEARAVIEKGITASRARKQPREQENSPAERMRLKYPASRASWPTARKKIRASLKSTSSKVTPQADLQRPAVTVVSGYPSAPRQDPERRKGTP